MAPAVCRKKNEGTMCPSYMVTLEDKHSTRGRANLMREILSGKLPAEEFTGKDLHDALDLCLECKGCKAECPSNVDMAKLKYEFLAHYNEANGTPIRSRMFANIHSTEPHRFALAFDGKLDDDNRPREVAPWIVSLESTPAESCLSFADQTFESWFQCTDRTDSPQSANRHVRQGCSIPRHVHQLQLSRYRKGDHATARSRRLRSSHRRTAKCCGRPMISKGLPEEAREQCGIQCSAALSIRGERIFDCGLRAELHSDIQR